jgi:hypothetical protein
MDPRQPGLANCSRWNGHKSGIHNGISLPLNQFGMVDPRYLVFSLSILCRRQETIYAKYGQLFINWAISISRRLFLFINMITLRLRVFLPQITQDRKTIKQIDYPLMQYAWTTVSLTFCARSLLAHATRTKTTHGNRPGDAILNPVTKVSELTSSAWIFNNVYKVF